MLSAKSISTERNNRSINKNETGKLDFMNARARSIPVESVTPQIETVTPQTQAGCAACGAYEQNLCQAVFKASWSLPQTETIEFQKSAHVVPARRIVFRQNDLPDAVPVICDGWAASIVMLSDGSRQILSFLLPGDIVSTALLFDARAHCFVEAITEVRYRTFKRNELRAVLLKQPSLFDALSKAWIEEKNRSDQIIVDLGRRSADERIARLILGLAKRLAQRGMTRTVGESGLEMDFPLRQHHIADASGLTPVHVSKVLSEFRRAGLTKISDRSLTIIDQAGLRRIAHMR